MRGLTLERAMGLAEGLHPELAVARARVEAADARALQAGLFPNPNLVARMESARFRGDTTGQAEYVAGVSQPLPLGGRIAAASRIEELQRDRLILEYRAQRIEIQTRVHSAFGTALYTAKVGEAQAEALRISESAVAVARARLAAGDALPDEVARAEMEGVRARLDLEQARSLQDLAMQALAAAVGEPTLNIESLEGDLEEALEVPALEALLERLGQSALVAAGEAEVRVAWARIDLAEARRIPDVNLDLFYRRLEHSKADAFDAGIGLAIPLFDRGQGRVREARAEAEASEARARSLHNQVTHKVREAHAKLSRAIANTRVLKEEILPRADTVLRAAEARYAAGDVGLADVLPIRRDHTSVRLAYLESLRDVMEAWANLKPFAHGE